MQKIKNLLVCENSVLFLTEKLFEHFLGVSGGWGVVWSANGPFYVISPYLILTPLKFQKKKCQNFISLFGTPDDRKKVKKLFDEIENVGHQSRDVGHFAI